MGIKSGSFSKIPFNAVSIIGREMEYVHRAVRDGKIKGGGRFTDRCEAWMQKRFAARRVLLTHSCTSALEMCGLLINLKPGDEIILPSYTFVSTANAFMRFGVTPVFADIRPDTLNIDESVIEKLITKKTRTIVVVHYAGIGCEMNRILHVARKYGLPVIEDAAHAFMSRYHGRSLGTLGTLGAYSFHQTKNYTCGEGGALVINDPRYINRAEVLIEKGTNHRQFDRGKVNRYTWVDFGGSFILSEILAACLYGQLERANEILEDRLELWEHYHRRLEPLEQKGFLKRPVVPEGCAQNGHLYYVILRSENERERLGRFLEKKGVSAPFHYIPLHQSRMGKLYGRCPGPLRNTESIASCLLRLPLFFKLTVKNQERVTRHIHEFFKK